MTRTEQLEEALRRTGTDLDSIIQRVEHDPNLHSIRDLARGAYHVACNALTAPSQVEPPKDWLTRERIELLSEESRGVLHASWDIDALCRMALHALEKGAGWQGMESAPKDVRVLLLWGDVIIGGILEDHDEDGFGGPEVWTYWVADGDLLIEDGPDRPTAWMRCPPPPSDEASR